MDKLKLCEIVREATKKYVCENFKLKVPPEEEDLSGACGLASVVLQLIFEQYGYKSELHEMRFKNQNEGHCYVVCDNIAYDVTHSQFGHPPIRVEKLGDFYPIQPNRIHHSLATFNHWKSYQQKPKKRRINKILKYVKEICPDIK